MTGADSVNLIAASGKTHGGNPAFVQSLPVCESVDGAPVWEGVIHIFDLAGNPDAARAYSGSSSTPP